MTSLIAQEAATQVADVGGKAAALARLAQAGFEPPPFFVIPAALAALPDAPGDLAAALTALGPGPYAVRSSARAEDGTHHSHAGQFETMLNVAAKDIWSAAQQVFRSGFSDTVATYRDLRAGGEAEGPAVIVQKMIDAQAAGVAFSADPVSGLRDRVVISATSGLGDRLVSGEADGEDWVVGTAAQGPSEPQVLTASLATEIAGLARRAEATFGLPQDIEWAHDGQDLYILQSRPITTALLPPPQRDTTLTIFDNSNIVESYPGLVSPLTYSFAVYVYDRVYRAFVALLGVPDATIAHHASVFSNMLGRVDGRVYYNLVNWYRALALLPGFSLNRAHMETMMGVATPLPDDVTQNIGPPPAQGVARLGAYLRLGRVTIGLLAQAIRLPRTRRRFYARLEGALGSGFDPETAGPTALAAEYRRVETTLLDRWDAPLVNDFLCMIAFGASRKLLERWLGPDGLTLHNDVMIGQGDIVSAEPAQRIARLGELVRHAGCADALVSDGLGALDAHPAIEAEVSSYLTRFGDRCTEELKLESIPLRDDPTPLLHAIAASAQRPPAPRPPATEPDWARHFANAPLKRRIARATVSWAKARVRDRENLRSERTRIFGHTRRVFLALGRELAARGLLSEPRDVFYLTKDELLGAVEGYGVSPDLKALAALRKAEDTASLARPDPPERIELRGPVIAMTASANGPGTSATSATPQSQQSARTGTGCSAGRVQAVARVITDPRRQSLPPGDILVARHTDPGWIAVFANASAIVVERGSLLSHSAIVARELGIPCVVGLKGATHWIQDGETITVNGATGHVERNDDPLLD
ncbi:MAG: PEP/pyruvate-binding domain-containing protein [Pseudomonadota bacterium]